MDTRQSVNGAELLPAAEARGSSTVNDLTPLLYAELRRIAKRQLRHEHAQATLATTSLVHEAYLRIASAKQVHVHDPSHLLALAARLMRRILVDHARSRSRVKRFAGASVLPLEDAFKVARDRATELVRLDDCLDALSRMDPRKARVVEMRFFGGLSVVETAQALEVSADTVVRDWRLSKLWLMREMRRKAGDDV
jgi:RNA polymerase sigma factor (TIGR02999 family)